MQVSEPVDQETVLLSVVESELFSRRFPIGLGERIPEALNERLRYAPVSDWSPQDRQDVITAVRGLCPELLEPLLRVEVRWFGVSIEEFDLSGLETMALPEFLLLAPDRQLVTLVSSLDKGLDTPDAEFSGDYRRLKRSFRPSEMRGRPCLVGKAREGPFTVFEGLNRLAVILSLDRAGRPVPIPIPAYLGVTDRLSEVAWATRAEELGPPSIEEPERRS